MKPHYVALILILIAGAAWWLLSQDVEAQIYEAHRELARLVNKTEDEGSMPSVLDTLKIQVLFADRCEVSGDADQLIGAYTPDEMAGLIIRARGLFRTIELSFSEIVIELRADDDAIARFMAELRASGDLDASAEVHETRSVTSRLRKIDGDWRFSELKFALPE
jgi:hypothetical protein